MSNPLTPVKQKTDIAKHSQETYLLPKCFNISRHALAHSRHSLAHAAIILSSAIFSQAVAHSSQHLAQHSHAGPASEL